MNVIHILWELGYQVLDIQDGKYTVMKSNKRIKKEREDGQEVKILDKYVIYVEDTGFNGFGDLYVSFAEVGKEDEIFDMYEYESLH